MELDDLHDDLIRLATGLFRDIPGPRSLASGCPDPGCSLSNNDNHDRHHVLLAERFHGRGRWTILRLPRGAKSRIPIGITWKSRIVVRRDSSDPLLHM